MNESGARLRAAYHGWSPDGILFFEQFRPGEQMYLTTTPTQLIPPEDFQLEMGKPSRGQA